MVKNIRCLGYAVTNSCSRELQLREKFQIGLGLKITNCIRVLKGPTSSGPNLKTNLKPKSCPKKTKVKSGLKNLAMLPSYFDYIFVRLTQKSTSQAQIKPDILCQL